jgi:hypothetical protein
MWPGFRLCATKSIFVELGIRECAASVFVRVTASIPVRATASVFVRVTA